MAQLLEDSSFCEEFIQQCPAAVEVLNLVAQECSPGELLPTEMIGALRPLKYSIIHLICIVCCRPLFVTVFCHLVQESALAWWSLNVKE